MPEYKENPKMKGSYMYGCIPQKGKCPNKCDDCFFQSRRSYLEPLDENLPNIPRVHRGKIIRVNDGNDSFFLTENQIQDVIYEYPQCFFNTSIPKDLDKYHTWSHGLMMEAGVMNNHDYHPVVLTVNPSEMTDASFHKLDPIPKYLMFVRFRVNTWNLALAKECISYYTSREVPVVLTFMAYFNQMSIHEPFRCDYIWRMRTINPYWAITTIAWKKIMAALKWNEDNFLVHSCGAIEGVNTQCRYCGNCLREYFATKQRMETK